MSPALVPLDTEDYWHNPYPTLARLRDEHRTAVSPDGQRIILRWADAEAMKKSSDFINEGLEYIEARGFRPGDPLYEWRRYSIGARNGDDHQRLRRLVNRAMTMNSVDRMRPTIRAHADKLLFDAADKTGRGELDVRSAIRSLPFLTITDFLGIDVADAMNLGQTMAGGGDAFGPNVTPEIRDRANQTFARLMEFVGGLVEARRTEPRDDLLSALLAAEEDGDRLSHEELIVLFTNIFGGAVESTASVMTSTFYELARHPEQLALLRDNPDGLKRSAVEEIVRHRPAFYATGQKAARATTLAGVDFAADEPASIVIGGPNRDPSRWDNPDRFDITRDPTNWSLSFSMGNHFCLGQALARTEIQEVAASIATHCQDLEIVGEPRWLPFVMVNQLDSLVVRYRHA